MEAELVWFSVRVSDLIVTEALNQLSEADVTSEDIKIVNVAIQLQPDVDFQIFYRHTKRIL